MKTCRSVGLKLYEFMYNSGKIDIFVILLPMRFIVYILFWIYSTSLFAQHAPDTSQFPYWIDMMQDRKVNIYQTKHAFEKYWDGRSIDKSSGYKPFKRWAYVAEREADAQGNLPSYGELYAAIYRYYDSLSGNLQTQWGGAPCNQSGIWVEIGPRDMPGNRTSQPNGMGRLNAIAFHPKDSNIIWAGAPAGGLWKTSDKGKTWTCNTDTLPTLGVSSIVIHPNQPDIIYIGTGDRDASDAYSRGVMKSTDGGNSWQWANSGMGNATVGMMVIDEKRPDTLLAATSGGIYRTTNGGSSWTLVQGGGFFKDIVFKPGSADTLYATRNGLFFRSVNNGINWTQISSGLPSGTSRGAIAVSKSAPELVYFVLTNSSTFNSLCLSTNGGSSFSVRSTSPNIMDYSHLGSGTGGQAWYDLDIAADPHQAGVIYVGGVNIFKSTDSGATWKINAHWVGTGAPNMHADQHVLEFSPSGFGLYAGNDGGIYETFNGGTQWLELSQGLGIAQIYRLAQSATQRETVINGYQDNGTGMMENGKWYTVMGGDGMDCQINPSDASWAYSDLYYGDVRRYKNGSFNGKIAGSGSNGITESGAWVTSFVLQEGTPTTMFIGYKNVWRSTNVTASSASAVAWTKISDNLGGSNSQNIVYLENTVTDPNILYMSRGDQKMFRSDNVNAASPTWTDLTSSLPSSGTVVWIESHPSIANRLFIIRNNKIYQSNNKGGNWTDISGGLPAIPLLSLVCDSSSRRNAMYIGTYMGVFYYDTVQASWTWFNQGMPVNTRATDLDIYYDVSGRAQSHIVASTYGRGNWKSPLYDEDPIVPEAGFKWSESRLCVGQKVRLTDTSLYLPTAWYWKVEPINGRNFAEQTDSNSQHPVIEFSQTGTYTISLYVENCKGVDSLIQGLKVEVGPGVTPAACPGYTQITGTNYGMGIFSFTTDTFTHHSKGTYEEGGYLDLACNQIFRLKTDTFYLASVITGTSYGEYVKIYADLNNDGQLTAAELLMTTPRVMTAHNDTLFIPKTAVSDTLLRLRILSDYDSIPHACDTLKYGQTQDYGLILEKRIPEPWFIASADSLCLHTSVQFTDSSFGNIQDYFWEFGDGANPSSSTGKGPHQVQYTSSGYKKIKLTLNQGEANLTRDSLVYIKLTPDLSLDLSAGNDSLCEQEPFALKAHDASNLPSSYYWYKNGVSFANSGDSILSVGSSKYADSGSYVVIKTLQGCSDTSAAFLMTVWPKPTLNLLVDDDTQCLNNNQFQFQSGAGILHGHLTYAWDFDDGHFSSLTNPFHAFTDIGLFMIKLKVQSDKNCTAEDSIGTYLHPSPTASFELSDSIICLNNHRITFRSISIFGFGTLKYFWRFGDGLTDTLETSEHTYANSGTYLSELQVSSTDGCSDTIAKLVQVIAHPTAQMTLSDSIFCLNNHSLQVSNSSVLPSGTTLQNMIWNFGDGHTDLGVSPAAYSYSDTGKFALSMVILHNLGCADSIKKSIYVSGHPKAVFQIDDDIQCQKCHLFHLTPKLSADVQNWSYQFSSAHSEIPAGSGFFQFSDTGTIDVKMLVSNVHACADSSLSLIRILPNPIVSFRADTICLEEEVRFINLSSAGSVVWDFGDGKSSTLQNPVHTYQTAGAHTVSLAVLAANGCADTLLQTGIALVHPKPIAHFTYDTEIGGSLTTAISFHNISQHGNTYSWDFERFGQYSDYEPILEITDSATFYAHLAVNNNFGCKDSFGSWITIIPYEEIWVPNIFTPNSDLLNDQFIPKGVRYSQLYRLQIFNRWGEKVFESEKNNESWDGRYLDEPVETGMYVYILDTINAKGERKLIKGTLMLVR